MADISNRSRCTSVYRSRWAVMMRGSVPVITSSDAASRTRPCFAPATREHRHSGVVEVLEHLPHVAVKPAPDFHKLRAMPPFAEKKVGAQLVFDVAHVAGNDGWRGSILG